MNNQSSAIDIPTNKTTRIVATTTSDGHTMLSSTVTDCQGQPIRRNSLNSSESGISPTYYTSGGSMVQTSRKEDAHKVGSPVYGDNSRIFFSHNSTCSCLGSGVGCECSKTLLRNVPSDCFFEMDEVDNEPVQLRIDEEALPLDSITD